MRRYAARRVTMTVARSNRPAAKPLTESFDECERHKDFQEARHPVSRQDTRDSVIARRNVLAGLWAGRLLGLSNADLSSYATEVHRADFESMAMRTSSERSPVIWFKKVRDKPAPITVKHFVRWQ